MAEGNSIGTARRDYWHADHDRPLWLPLVIATIVMSVVTAIYVLQGFLTSVRLDERSPGPDGDHEKRDP